MATSGREGTGKGRNSSTRAKLMEAGMVEEARAIAPPSEQLLKPSERCGARTQKPGNPPCSARKGGGTLHPGYGYCQKHGGNTEAGVKSAMREMGADLARQYKAEYSRFGGSRKDPTIANLTPEEALLEEVRRSAAMVRFLEERIAQWNLSATDQATIEMFSTMSTHDRKNLPDLRREVHAIIEARIADSDSPGNLPPLTSVHDKTGITSFTDAREWLYLYREERGHLARTAKMCIDAGVAQRLVSIAEDQGRILATAIRAVLRALSLTPEQAALVPQIVPPILRAVATDSPLPELNIVEGKVIES